MSIIDIQPDPSGLHSLEPDGSSLYLSAHRRVRRAHTANQMKRVQGDESPWRRSGAAAVPLPHFAPAYSPRGKRRKANMITQKRTLPRRRLRSLRPFVSPSGSPPQKMRDPEMNQPSPITARQLENALMAISTPRRNQNVSFRKPSCLARASNSRRERTQDICIGTYNRHEQTHDIPLETHGQHNPTIKHPHGTAHAAPQDPARTIPSARAATGQTQHCAGLQFTRL